MDKGLLIALVTSVAALAGVLATQVMTWINSREQASRAERLLASQSALAATREAQAAALAEAREAQLAERGAQREAAHWARAQAAERAASLAARREEFLGWVLLAESRMADRLDRGLCPVAASESPANAARQAYAVALLYLEALRPLAKDFYQSTAKLQLALEASDGTAARRLASTWRESFSSIEAALVEASDGPP